MGEKLYKDEVRRAFKTIQLLWSCTLKNMIDQLQSMMAEAAGITLDSSSVPNPCEKNPFRLPIAYDDKHAYPLSDIVIGDLELVDGPNPMYDVLFQPTNLFGKDMIQQWKRQYSSDPVYLKETQLVIQQVSVYPEKPIDDKVMRDIWHETKESGSDYFLEKYCFVEWDWLKFLNKSPAILQILSVANMMSPVISLVMPFLFLLFPFLILKLRGIPITFSVYKDVLQDVARNHFIGKALTNLSSLSVDKLVYFFFMAGLYFWQIYQNVLVCQRFYKNMFRINAHLMAVKEYCRHTVQDMLEFVNQHETSKTTYHSFCQDVRKHASYLQRMQADLQSISPMTTIYGKLGSIGYMLQRYYELHVNDDYEQGLLYSFGFQGFLDNLRGLRQHLDAGTLNAAKLIQQGATRIDRQVYPLLATQQGGGKGGVTNNCRLDKNLIITGPMRAARRPF